MERHLSLIKNELGKVEKRVFPRFPFSYFTFKSKVGNSKNGADAAKTFEVLDISHTGMQLSLKDGGHHYIAGDELQGELRWRGQHLHVLGLVKWAKARRLGVAFDKNDKIFLNNIKEFLCTQNLVSLLRPIHNAPFELEIPSNLKYWLRADGALEIFIWRHNDGELSKFNIILLDKMVEWNDGHGLRSGKVLTRRDMETPLFTEDEFMFRLDEKLDETKLELARDIMSKVPTHLIPEGVLEFVILKLGHTFN